MRKPSTMARWASFHASSVGVRCQLMPASLPGFAPAVKPRGTVAIGVGRDYIWTMDETELTRRLGQPDNIIGREERMRSLGWVCSLPKRHGERRADALSRAMLVVRRHSLRE